eukprot:gene16754-biopygen2492
MALRGVEDADTAELGEDHEDAESGGYAEHEGRLGAGGKAVESSGASAEGRRRRRGQGRLRTAHERAGKAEDGGYDRPQVKMLRLEDDGKLKEAQADAGRWLSLLKLQILLEAQKAVDHQRAAGKEARQTWKGAEAQADLGGSLSLLKMQSVWEALEPEEHARTAGKVGADAEGRDGSAKTAKVVGDEARCEGDGLCETSLTTPEAVEACTGLRTMSEAWEGVGGCRRQGCRRDAKEDRRRVWQVLEVNGDVEDAEGAEDWEGTGNGEGQRMGTERRGSCGKYWRLGERGAQGKIAYGGARPWKAAEDNGRYSDEFSPRSGRCGRRRMVAQGHRRQWKSVEGEVSVRNPLHTMGSVEGRRGMYCEGAGRQRRPLVYGESRGGCGGCGNPKKVRGFSEPAHGSEDADYVAGARVTDGRAETLKARK